MSAALSERFSLREVESLAATAICPERLWAQETSRVTHTAAVGQDSLKGVDQVARGLGGKRRSVKEDAQNEGNARLCQWLPRVTGSDTGSWIADGLTLRSLE